MTKKKLTINEMHELDYATKEAFNSLRTNLRFCGTDIKIVMFTSCFPNEGKSSVSFGLAKSLAEDGKKILFLDADLRKSVLIGEFKIEIDGELSGMSHYLTGQAKPQDIIYESDVPGLDLILSGPSTPNPTELLGSSFFTELLEAVRADYDMVIIDSPPLGSVIDTAVIAPSCDGVIMVVESNLVSYRFAESVKKQLEVTGCRILGVVLNKVELKKGGYYQRYYKGYYKKYYGKPEDKK